MGNLHLFELINAGLRPSPLSLGLALALARWLALLPAAGLMWAWVRGDDGSRLELLQMLLAALLSLVLAQGIAYLWPQPRPFALHLGQQLLAHADEPGMPGDQVTLLWSLAWAALGTSRFAVWSYLLFAAGLAVGWSRVFLGVQFPYDVLAAMPVALAGTVASWALRPLTMPLLVRCLRLHDGMVLRWRKRWHQTPKH